MDNTPTNILREAHDAVYNDRAARYGHPRESFTCIAGLWETYLVRRGLLNEDASGLFPRDVANMLVLLKVAREAQSPQRDNLVDIAGYAAAAERCEEAR